MRARASACAAALMFVSALALLAFMFTCRSAAKTSPSPTDGVVQQSTGDGEAGFPAVDWDYWQGVNADVIGWITIPGTTVNSPILQAHAEDPNYYLTHDVYGNWNRYGAIYLDAECESEGLSSINAVILGHHFGEDYEAAPFGIVAEYKNASFAREHKIVLIQTPNSKMSYEVRFANIVEGSKPLKRVSFASEQDFCRWYDDSLDCAVMVLDGASEPQQITSLVTCSYNIWAANERTVVIASMSKMNG